MKPKPKLNSSLTLPLASAIAALLAGHSLNAADQTWDGGTDGTGTAWISSTNWAGDTGWPGSQTVTTNTDVATFTATGTNTAVGINMNFTGNTLYLGAINMTGNRNRTIGNSSTSANGTLVFNGATLNSVANTILRNSSSNLLTIQNTQGSGDKTMNVALGNATNNIIQIGSSGGVTISSNISGSGRQLSRQGDGSGSLTLSGNNTFSGGLNFTGAAILALQHSNAAGTGTINIASTRISTDTAAIMTLAGGINVANDIIMDSATGRNTINAITSGSNTLSGNITINNNGSANQVAFNNQAGNNTTFTIGAATPNSTTLTATTYAGSISFRSNNNTTSVGVINSQILAPNATFNINNDGVWTVNSTGNSWAATTMSTASSRIILGANDAIATGARIDFGAVGASVNLNGKNQSVAGLVGSSTTAQIFNSSNTSDSILTLAGLSADRAFSGSITDGSGGKKTSLVMNSSGRTQTLAGTNTYTGATTVSAGTLLVNGSLGNTAVTVDPLAIIGGTGSIGGSLAFDADSFLRVVDFSDPLAVAGSVTFGSGFGIDNLLGINWDILDLNTPYTVLSTTQTFGTGDIANFGLANAVAVGTSGRQAYFTNGSLNVVVIPEPRAALLGGIGLLILLRRRRG